jgi:hypothetical protein
MHRYKFPGFTVLLLVSFLVATAGAGQERLTSTVGAPLWIRDIVLPGPELEVKPTDVTTPVVVRIAAVYPHGAASRYDISCYGLDPGEYDLRDFLKRCDGSSTEDLPPILIEVRSVLSAGQVQPHRPERGELPRVGGYRKLLIGAGVLWVIGLVAIIAIGRRRRQLVAGAEKRPRTLAERLRPLVEEAMAGTLSGEDRAELELALIAFWREKLGLDSQGVAEALAELKQHAEAGPLVRQLEDWLHHPAPEKEVDLAALLAPYQGLPDEPATRHD